MPFIPENPYLKQSKLRQIFENAPAGSINLGLGQPGEDTPEFIREALKKIAADQSFGYTLNAGILPLREKLAAEMKGISPDQICLTSGVQEGLYALFYTLFNEESDLLLPDPGFLSYPLLAHLNKCNPRFYKLSATDNFHLNADRIISEIRPETQAILVAHPSNPTGSVASKQEIKKLLDFCRNRKEGPIWIISDEVYYGMTYTECDSFSNYLGDYPYIILFRGASKSHHMTGWRLGWAVLPKELIKPYIASHQFICTCASAVTQHVFNDIRGNREESEWLKFQNDLYRRKRDLVYDKLSSYRSLFGGEGAFYWLMKLNDRDLATGNDENWVMNVMKEHLVTTIPGSAFGEQSNGYVRLSYGPKIEDLKTGLERLIEVLK